MGMFHRLLEFVLRFRSDSSMVNVWDSTDSLSIMGNRAVILSHIWVVYLSVSS
jgi:hypothetical protein